MQEVLLNNLDDETSIGLVDYVYPHKRKKISYLSANMPSQISFPKRILRALKKRLFRQQEKSKTSSSRTLSDLIREVNTGAFLEEQNSLKVEDTSINHSFNAKDQTPLTGKFVASEDLDKIRLERVLNRVISKNTSFEAKTPIPNNGTKSPVDNISQNTFDPLEKRANDQEGSVSLVSDRERLQQKIRKRKKELKKHKSIYAQKRKSKKSVQMKRRFMLKKNARKIKASLSHRTFNEKSLSSKTVATAPRQKQLNIGLMTLSSQHKTVKNKRENNFSEELPLRSLEQSEQEKRFTASKRFSSPSFNESIIQTEPQGESEVPLIRYKMTWGRLTRRLLRALKRKIFRKNHPLVTDSRKSLSALIDEINTGRFLEERILAEDRVLAQKWMGIGKSPSQSGEVSQELKYQNLLQEIQYPYMWHEEREQLNKKVYQILEQSPQATQTLPEEMSVLNTLIRQFFERANETDPSIFGLTHKGSEKALKILADKGYPLAQMGYASLLQKKGHIWNAESYLDQFVRNPLKCDAKLPDNIRKKADLLRKQYQKNSLKHQLGNFVSKTVLDLLKKDPLLVEKRICLTGERLKCGLESDSFKLNQSVGLWRVAKER